MNRTVAYYSGETMAEEQKAMAWIGVAASVVAVLAFFGITSFDDLRNAVDSTGASSDACEQASEATRELREKQGSNGFDGTEAFGDYAPKIRSAAEKAEDQKLKSLLLDDADAAQDLAAEYARNDTYSASTNNRLAAARNQWIKICDKSGRQSAAGWAAVEAGWALWAAGERGHARRLSTPQPPRVFGQGNPAGGMLDSPRLSWA